MPRGRKRRISAFVPQAWIPNSSSEDEYGRDDEARQHVPWQVERAGNLFKKKLNREIK